MDSAAVYHGPLEGFVSRRTALERTLRSSDAAAAAAVKKLRKPSVGAWAIDQLAVENPDLVAELLAAGLDAREAQQAVADGSRSGEDLLVATTRVREAIEGAVRAAAQVLERSGQAMAEETARKIRTTVLAAASGGAADRQALWRGTLDRDLTPTGFGAADVPDDDEPELARAIAPLRRQASPRRRGAATGGARVAAGDRVAQLAAERGAAERLKVAERARTIAATKRQHAERLAAEARAADDDATAAERSAEAAEKAAR
ncbi:MAG TPA: hypothetical protein VH661_03505 [Candidatus Dormibacteraeota bacterium]|nr:hypothetical protein [Candidatus Dormibacteraeota bacterium]